MRRASVVLTLLVCALLAVPAMAQSDQGNVTQVFVTNAKAGQAGKLEEGVKKHRDWHKQQNDTWIYDTWQVLTGPAIGSYVTVSSGHNWADFDERAKMQDADDANSAVTFDPYVESSQMSYYEFLPNESRPVDGPPQMYVEVIHFYPKQDKDQHFRHLVGKAHEAIGKTNWPVNYYWYTLANGGDHPHFVLAIPHKNMASMKGPDKPFPAMIMEAFGPIEGQMVLDGFGEAVQSQWSELLRYRADLSTARK